MAVPAVLQHPPHAESSGRTLCDEHCHSNYVAYRISLYFTELLDISSFDRVFCAITTQT